MSDLIQLCNGTSFDAGSRNIGPAFKTISVKAVKTLLENGKIILVSFLPAAIARRSICPQCS